MSLVAVTVAEHVAEQIDLAEAAFARGERREVKGHLIIAVGKCPEIEDHEARARSFCQIAEMYLKLDAFGLARMVLGRAEHIKKLSEEEQQRINKIRSRIPA